MPSAFAKPAEKVNVNMSYALLPLNCSEVRYRKIPICGTL